MARPELVRVNVSGGKRLTVALWWTLGWCSWWLLPHLYTGAHGALTSSVPIVQPHQNRIVLQEGAHLQLVCPVVPSGSSSEPRQQDGSPSASSPREGILYEWMVKKMPNYVLSTDRRYRISMGGQRLEIVRPVSVEDSGPYECTGISGFGSQKVVFQVHVFNSSTYRSKCAVSKTSDSTQQAPCFLTNLSRDVTESTQRVQVGQSLELSCDSWGVPDPNYAWYVGSQLAEWSGLPLTGGRSSTLRIATITPQMHATNFVCRVENVAGVLEHHFQILISDPVTVQPKFLTQPANRTVTVGQREEITVKLDCDCQPIVKWLKRVDESERLALASSREKANLVTLPLNSELGEEFLVLSVHKFTSSSASGSNSVENQTPAGNTRFSYRYWVEPKDANTGTFVAQLILPEVRQQDLGKYVLLTHSQELDKVNYRSMWVQVSSDGGGQSNSSNLILYIAAPLCILILMVFLCVYCLIKRYQKNHQPPGTSRSCTSSSAATTSAAPGTNNEPQHGNGGTAFLVATPSTRTSSGKPQYYIPLMNANTEGVNHPLMMNHPMTGNGMNGEHVYYPQATSTTSPSMSQQTQQFMFRPGGPSPVASGGGGPTDGSSNSVQYMPGYFPGNNSSSSNGGYSTGHFLPPQPPPGVPQPQHNSQHFLLQQSPHYPA